MRSVLEDHGEQGFCLDGRTDEEEEGGERVLDAMSACTELGPIPGGSE